MRRFFENRSLRFRLVIALSLVSFVIWVLAMVVEWNKARDEVDKLFDAQQVLFAERLASSDIFQGFHEVRHRGLRRGAKKVDDDALAFAVYTENGQLITHDNRNGRYIPFAPKRGFSQVTIYEDDGDKDEWRIFWLKHRDIFIAVGQELDYRDDLINDIVFVQLWVWLAGLPLLILAILWVVNRELRSLRLLKKQVTQRKPDDFSQISKQNLPLEIFPLVDSLNNYLARTQTMFNRERRFTSDAAHELRSPLAALRIQTELAQLTMDDPKEHSQALGNITQSIDRIALLIEQLLTLSRLENLVELDELEPIDWQRLIESNVAQLYLQAEQKGSEIEVEVEHYPQNQQGKSMLLSLVLRNLIENAINYTPEGSLIRVSLSEQKLVVEDNGTGVSEADLAKLGQPFYRPVDRPDSDNKGSGLGISIVKRIVELHRFKLNLSASELGGLKVEVIF
ncbi:two-component system sensor histidine kinase QseC [Pasteurellaceae bacterium RH1A]|nr:two-component system sensor histidine kinase QseC [Pasteurellaceae bacterium RH1A]